MLTFFPVFLLPGYILLFFRCIPATSASSGFTASGGIPASGEIPTATNDVIDPPMEQEPERFYGSDLIWNSYLENKDEFISMFQLPSTALVISGNAKFISEQLAMLNATAGMGFISLFLLQFFFV